VQLEVMDLAGRSVATIWNGAAPAGKTRVAWTARDRDGRPLRPGAYFAKFSDGQSRSARRLVLVP
jgi:flagellar hook assembly protein FlgD